MLALQRYVVLVAKVSKNAEAIKAKTLVANGPPQRKMWKRALTKSFVARDVQQELTDTRSSFAHKKDEELTFEERFHRSRENELVRTYSWASHRARRILFTHDRVQCLSSALTELCTVGNMR